MRDERRVQSAEEIIKGWLDELAEWEEHATVLQLDKQRVIDSLLTSEVKATIADFEATFEGEIAAVNDQIAEITARVKDAVLVHGNSVKGEHRQAVWQKGRISWDTKALDGYAAAHPEIARFRQEGTPSVNIRRER